MANPKVQNTELVHPPELYRSVLFVLAGSLPELCVEVPPDVLRFPAYRVAVQPRRANSGFLPVSTRRIEAQSERSQVVSVKRVPRARKKSPSPKRHRRSL